MSQWTERFQNHQLWKDLQTLGPILDNALSREGIDPQAIENINRIKSVLTFIGKRIAGADIFLFQSAVVDSLQKSVDSISVEINNFISNGNVAHIANGNTHADSALSFLSQINVPITTDDYIGAKEAADTYRLSIDRMLKDTVSKYNAISTELEALKGRIGELVNETTAEKGRVSTISTEFQSQFSSAQEIRNRDFSAMQKEQQGKFATTMAEYANKIGEQINEYITGRQETARLHNEEIGNLKNKWVEEATSLRNEILERKVEVEKLVGVIGNLGVTSGYQKTAEGAKKTATVWQIATVSSMLGLIWIAYCAFLPMVKGDFTWSGFAGRVFVSLTVGVLAAYSASQADKYQKIEKQNRRLALELEAIRPFIAPLPKDKQEEFIKLIGERSFGHGDAGMSGGDAKSPATLLDLISDPKHLKAIVDILGAIKK